MRTPKTTPDHPKHAQKSEKNAETWNTHVSYRENFHMTHMHTITNLCIGYGYTTVQSKNRVWVVEGIKRSNLASKQQGRFLKKLKDDSKPERRTHIFKYTRKTIQGYPKIDKVSPIKSPVMLLTN